MKQNAGNNNNQSKPVNQHVNKNKPRPEIRDDLDSRERKEDGFTEEDDKNAQKNKTKKK